MASYVGVVTVPAGEDIVRVVCDPSTDNVVTTMKCVVVCGRHPVLTDHVRVLCTRGLRGLES